MNILKPKKSLSERIRKLLFTNLSNLDIAENIKNTMITSTIYAIITFVSNYDKSKPITKPLIKAGLVAAMTGAISTMGVVLTSGKNKYARIPTNIPLLCGVVPGAEIANIALIYLLNDTFLDNLTNIIYNYMMNDGYPADSKTSAYNRVSMPMNYFVSKQPQNVLENAFSDLARLKQRLSANDASNPTGMFSKVGVGSTWNINYPFHPTLQNNMTGGNTLYDISQIIEQREGEYGSALITQLYQNIVDFLKDYNIKLSETDQQKITKKLEEFQKAELELNQELEDAANRSKILNFPGTKPESVQQGLDKLYANIPVLLAYSNKLGLNLLDMYQHMLFVAMANTKKN